jgi:hypothetical protein
MSIRVQVDPANPGQFFACCGLLELADRFWPGAVGAFDGPAFHIETDGELITLLHSLVECRAEEVTRLETGVEVKPLIAPLRLTFNTTIPFALILDGWMTVRVVKGEAAAVANPPWNFWSGQQTSLRIWSALRAALADQLTEFLKLKSVEPEPKARKPMPGATAKLPPDRLEDLFTRRVQLSGRFGFDPGPAWNALDAGFSPNEQGMEVASSPAVELLAAVGLQRFRPNMAPDRQTFDYFTWGRPLAPVVAAAAAAGSVPAPPSARFRGHVISRGSYAALGYSSPLTGENDE